MKLFSGVAKTLFVVLSIRLSYGTMVITTGNAYGGSGVRATWESTAPGTPDPVNLGTECIGQSTSLVPCVYSYNNSSSPNGIVAATVNVSGTKVSGVTFTGTNSNGNLLYARPLVPGNAAGNTFYANVNAQGAYSQVTHIWSTGPSGQSPSMLITVPTSGVRSVEFDFASLTGLSPGAFGDITVVTEDRNHLTSSVTVDRYDTSRGAVYTGTGPGFYGVTSTEDILTVSIIANASTSSWILNIANFRVGVQINAPTPEPDSFLAMGSALILLSFLLRRRGKFARGGAA